MTDIIFAGVDGGATNCRVRIENDRGELLGLGYGGTANPSHGVKTVTDSIMMAVTEAMRNADLPSHRISSLVVGAGLAGLHLPKYQVLMDSWVHPFKSLVLTDDLTTALYGAHAGEDGALIIAGTGFSAKAMVQGNETLIGGQGFLMGDYCSGAWLGFQAVQKVILAQDGLSAPTLLTELIQEHLGSPQIAEHLIGAKAVEYGRMAPLVFLAASSGDQIANRILDKSASFIDKVAEKLLATNPPRLSITGGVAEQITTRLAPTTIQQLKPMRLCAEQGAICFMKTQLGQ
ncbi:BadF/BadG/BcrA/BcrD ATPase family protein [Thalassotalea marina]|uniref:ATPase n=1 Tax=Thalassotalea marina TaxID=1673741 RepID=A0A919BPW2_9GAMM|nr:BadF/BadG/BcrA/BcrD ATPase family protein [Thalassotalea marina]GHG01927.1 ATPase [Thalassotalea marina]